MCGVIGHRGGWLVGNRDMCWAGVCGVIGHRGGWLVGNGDRYWAGDRGGC